VHSAPLHPGLHVACSDFTHEIVQWASNVNYQDFAIIKVGSVPPWMKLVDARNLTHDDGSGRFEKVYRLAAEATHEPHLPTARHVDRPRDAIPQTGPPSSRPRPTPSAARARCGGAGRHRRITLTWTVHERSMLSSSHRKIHEPRVTGVSSRLPDQRGARKLRNTEG
jgi:hypothetical protein